MSSRGVELELVEQLRRVAADEEEQPEHPLGRVLVGAREVELAREPAGLVGQVLHQHRPALGDRDVAEPLLLHRQVARGVAEVLGVAGLVEERAPVVGAADRLDHEHHLVRHLDRRAERARRLLRPLLDVELDVLLAVEVDPEVGQRRPQRRHHLLAREALVPLRRAEQALQVPALEVVERNAEHGSRGRVEPLFVELLGVGEERLALRGELLQPEAEALVELDVGLDAERGQLAAGRSRRRRGRSGSGAPRSPPTSRGRAARAARGRARSPSPGGSSGRESSRRRPSPRARPRARRASRRARA